MEAEIKKRIIGNVDKFASGFIAKNIHICIYTNLYFLTAKMSKSNHNIRNGGLNG
jgi:hypothetical protein